MWWTDKEGNPTVTTSRFLERRWEDLNKIKRVRKKSKFLHFVPGDHLLLLVGGVAAAAQVLAGRGEEVERVVLEVLVDEGKENLEEDVDNDKIAPGWECEVV